MATNPPFSAEPASSGPSRKTPPERRSDAHAGIVRSAGVVSAAVLLSRMTGLVREVVFANLFGAGFVYDAYLAAFRIPNLLRDLLAEGALSAAFVTTFSQYLETKGEAEAYRLSNRLATALIPCLALLCLAAIVGAPFIVDVMFPGFAEVPGKKELTVRLARIMAPFLLFIALAAKAMGVLNAKGKFGIPAAASALFNVGSLAVGLFAGFVLGPRFGYEPIVGMAIGTLFGGVLQYACQWPSLRRVGLRYRPELSLSDPGLRQVLRLMGPAAIGGAAVQVNIVVNSNFASQLTDAAGAVIDGPVAWLGYAFRFMQLPLGLFGVAIASATLPAISRDAERGRINEFRDTLSRSLGLVFLLTIPSAMGLIVLSRPLVGLIYQHGKFTATDTEQTAIALSFYCLGLAGYAAIKVLTPAFYALNDVRVPALISVMSILLNYAFNWTLVHVFGLGHGGLALSTSLVATLNFIALLWFMRDKIDGVEGRRLSSGVGKILVASTAMGLFCAASSYGMRQAFGIGALGRAADLAVSIPIGVAVLYALCRLMRVDELELAQRAVLARLFGKPSQSDAYARIDRDG